MRSWDDSIGVCLKSKCRCQVRPLVDNISLSCPYLSESRGSGAELIPFSKAACNALTSVNLSFAADIAVSISKVGYLEASGKTRYVHLCLTDSKCNIRSEMAFGP